MHTKNCLVKHEVPQKNTKPQFQAEANYCSIRTDTTAKQNSQERTKKKTGSPIKL